MRPGLVAASLALAVGGCSPSLAVDAPPPAVTADLPDTLPPVPPSVVEAPIVYDLRPAVAALEAVVPRRFGDVEQRLDVPGRARAHVAFAAERAPFAVDVRGRTVTVTTVVEYEARGWYKPPVAPEVSSSCGVKSERPRLRLVLSSTADIDTAWRLQARTRLRRVAPLGPGERDRCRVTFLRVDVTPHVVAAARSAIEGRLPALDHRIAGLDVRTRLERVWHALARPIRLADGVWLRINPSAVSLGSVAGGGDSVVAMVALVGAPRIMTGPRPSDGPPPPLPPLRKGRAVGDGLHGVLEGALDYGAASRALTARLRGKRVEHSGQTVEIRDLALSGIGGGKVALALSFRGTVAGRIYLTGTPRYDAATSELYVPDLDYDAGSLNYLVAGLAWLRGADVRDWLRAEARWPVRELLEEARRRMERGMNRELTRGVRLVSEVHEGDVVAVRATRAAVLLRARATGRMRLEISRAPQVPALARS